MDVYIQETAAATCHALIRHLIDTMNAKPGKIFHIAFSGGDSLLPLFDRWANDYGSQTPWERMRIYWSDERCVPVDDSDSNYGTLCRLLLDKVDFPLEHIYPLSGIFSPKREAVRYARVVSSMVPLEAEVPVFDLILLGLEPDGHVASIYPGQERLLALRELYAPCYNPYSGQRCITMTGTALLAAHRLLLLAVGRHNLTTVSDVLHSGDVTPAAYVAHHAPSVGLFVDRSAYKR
ncbi:6-phosphogluconolactonase [Mediterranea massiliensis]|uniref:6-phosphogluconolactonase n=1 Tax=Mediterranea massiliensis TaxID=1841865 RepID=UPI0023F2D00A|nr:6-phosphogluconolactonase [Mediterranea massiliensis]